MTPRRTRPGTISLLVPFRADEPVRTEVWSWLRSYWEHELPAAEIVVGLNDNSPFCKTCAVNQAAKRAAGTVFVILDADVYFDGEVIQRCADRITQAERYGHPLWFVPYRRIYRLTQPTTARLLTSSPQHPLRFPSPPTPVDVESTAGSSHGHRFGALIQIMSRTAFTTVGGMDPQFMGWGGEDVAFVRAVDTLYGRHQTTNNDVLHMWHTKIGTDFRSRQWAGQAKARVNEPLASRYNLANGNPEAMRALVNEGLRRRRRIIKPRAVDQD